jgi:hypothetical protein
MKAVAQTRATCTCPLQKPLQSRQRNLIALSQQAKQFDRANDQTLSCNAERPAAQYRLTRTLPPGLRLPIAKPAHLPRI